MGFVQVVNFEENWYRLLRCILNPKQHGKKRLKRTNTTKSPEISETTETKLPVNFTLQA